MQSSELLQNHEKSFCIFWPAALDKAAWEKWNQVPLARTRGGINGEAGKLVGKPDFSVKRPTLATLPKDPNGRLIESVPMDVLHMRMRVGEKLTKETISKSAAHTGDKFASTFQNLVR